MSQNRLAFFFFLVVICCFAQCNSNQDSNADLKNKAMYWQEDNNYQIPSKVEASILQFSNYYQIVIAGRGEGNDGLLLLLIAETDDVQKEHSLIPRANEQGIPFNKMSIKQNVLIDNMLEVYISEACRPVAGRIVITDFDPETYRISGYFDARLCTTGKLGRLAEKEIQNGHFKDIKMNYFDKR